MSKIGKVLDPFNIFGLNKPKKKIVPIVRTEVAKQGSEEEVAQRRLEVANRLRSNRKTTTVLPGAFGTLGDEERKAKLLGE